MLKTRLQNATPGADSSAPGVDSLLSREVCGQKLGFDMNHVTQNI